MARLRYLDGRPVIVTGAAAGLGRAYASALADAGARLVLNDIDGPALQRAHAELLARGADCVASVGSVADWAAMQELVGRCVADFGEVYGIVNNAGVMYVASAAEERDPARIQQLFATNVLGTAYAGVLAIQQMLTQAGGGVVLNVSSGAASGHESIAMYSASKGAISSLTYSWASELRERGIRVNAIAPSARTSMVTSVLDRLPSPVTWGPERIAPLVVYLLSDLARDVTGQVVRLWGDNMHLMAAHRPAEPFLIEDEWTVEKIDRAFAATLMAHRQPYGIEW